MAGGARNCCIGYARVLPVQAHKLSNFRSEAVGMHEYVSGSNLRQKQRLRQPQQAPAAPAWRMWVRGPVVCQPPEACQQEQGFALVLHAAHTDAMHGGGSPECLES